MDGECYLIDKGDESSVFSMGTIYCLGNFPARGYRKKFLISNKMTRVCLKRIEAVKNIFLEGEELGITYSFRIKKT